MKKFISMVMAAAMVVSLVPATAFAATGYAEAKAEAKVIEAVEKAEDFVGAKKVEGFIDYSIAPEVRFTLDEDVETVLTGGNGVYELELTYTIEGAEFTDGNGIAVEDSKYGEKAMLKNLAIEGKNGENEVPFNGVNVVVDDFTNTSVTYILSNLDADGNYDSKAALLKAGDVITFDLVSVMDDTSVGDVATVSVDTEIVGASRADMVYAEIVDSGLKVKYGSKLMEIAEDDDTTLKYDLKIESVIDDIVSGQRFELELTKGFEFVSVPNTGDWKKIDIDGRKAVIEYQGETTDKVTIAKDAIKVDAVDAKAGAICAITVEADKYEGKGFEATAEAVDVIEVMGEDVVISVDEDEDVPEMWSGVDAANTGLTEGDDEHWSLVVTVEESVAEAWDLKKGFSFELPEGVFVSDAKVLTAKNIDVLNSDYAIKTDNLGAWKEAYEEGKEQNLVFDRKMFKHSEAGKAELEFQLELVAEPGFVGDVALKFVANGEELGEVVIATFKTPVVVEAAQNDLVIDYRYTEVPTDIVVKEAEAGLWAVDTAFFFGLEKIDFEDDATYAVNEESEMEIDTKDNVFGFWVDEESDDEAAVVTINGISLYMDRNLAAGPYDLLMDSTLVCDETYKDGTPKTGYFGERLLVTNDNEEKIVDDVTSADGVVKEGFVNIITAGRDADDASFTTKVVVPVGESYIVAGEQTVALDVPAYVSAAGYTMLPVRAVAVALGIHNNNVLWDQASKTVTILYGQRIITMTVGSKVINVNGSAIPASASPEVVDGRTFLPMRDLATALGVTDITWDAATKTATLNGNK